jgi:NTP pyrophosphatase (non-canonical NTP hydrolase)
VLPLNDSATLADLQRYVSEMEHERGFARRGVVDQALLLGEEVGELFKAIRKQQKMRTAPSSAVGAVDEELVDVLIYVCAIANRLGIDLHEAFLRKEAINETRTWV